MDTNDPSPNALNIKYFGTLSHNHWGFLGIIKQYTQKTSGCGTAGILKGDFSQIHTHPFSHP